MIWYKQEYHKQLNRIWDRMLVTNEGLSYCTTILSMNNKLGRHTHGRINACNG
jgi:hypothetical protein